MKKMNISGFSSTPLKFLCLIEKPEIREKLESKNVDIAKLEEAFINDFETQKQIKFRDWIAKLSDSILFDKTPSYLIDLIDNELIDIRIFLGESTFDPDELDDDLIEDDEDFLFPAAVVNIDIKKEREFFDWVKKQKELANVDINNEFSVKFNILDFIAIDMQWVINLWDQEWCNKFEMK